MKKILLAIVALSAASFAHAQCTELFFSEIIEGSGNNKAIEIYNPTPNPITLSDYRIRRHSNGNTAVSDSLLLQGTIQPHDVWVVVNGQTTSQPNSPACDTVLQAMADQLAGAYPDPLYQNGDDALDLFKISTNQIIDIFGKIGEDPGSSWSDQFPFTDAQGSWWTKDHTLIRKSTVSSGVTVNPTAFDVTLEYDSLPQDDWSNLGIHNSVCSTSGINEVKNNTVVSAFPNPSNGTFTVTASATIKSTEIFNVLGEMVYSETFATASKEQQIDLSSQPAGLYLVQVKLANGKLATSKISIR
jgi:hypothetical protein